jgi:hypothetical protein
MVKVRYTEDAALIADSETDEMLELIRDIIPFCRGKYDIIWENLTIELACLPRRLRGQATMHNDKKCYIQLNVKTLKTRNRLFHTFFHELQHIRQLQSKKLQYVPLSFGDKIYWNGTIVPLLGNGKGYSKQPWEVDANEVSLRNLYYWLKKNGNWIERIFTKIVCAFS